MKNKHSLGWMTLTLSLIYLSFTNMVIQTQLFPSFEPSLKGYRFIFYMNFVSFPIIGLGLYSLITSFEKIMVKKSRGIKKSLALSLVSAVIAGSFFLSLYGVFPREFKTIGPYTKQPQYPSDYDFAAMSFIRKDLGYIAVPAEFVIMGDVDTATAATLEFGNIRLIKNGRRFRIVSVYQEPELYDLWGKVWSKPSINHLRYVMNLTGAKVVYIVFSYRLAMQSQQTMMNLIDIYTALLGPPVFKVSDKVYVFKYEETT